jgi:bacterial/archaeal transporter family protein
MDISFGIYFGVISMLSWGMSDFFIAKSVRGSGVLKSFIWAQATSVILLTIIFIGFYDLPSLNFYAIAMILVAGLLGVISNLSFYKSLRVGQVSIVMPIASCWAIITVILSLFFLGESLAYFQFIGIILAIAGAALVSFKLSDLKKISFDKHTHKGVEYAVVAAFAYGTNFVLIDLLVAELNWFLTILFIEITVVFYLLLYSNVTKRDISFPKNVMIFIIMVGILDAVAYLSYGIGVTSEFGSIVAPIAASSPAISIFLAKIFFKEKFEINQKIGIISVLSGLILLAT